MSWSQPSSYFDDLASINRSLIVPCAQTRFMATEANRNYLRITGGVLNKGRARTRAMH